MIKLFSIIVFCVFPLFTLSQEAGQGGAPKKADNEVSEAPHQTTEEVKLSEKQIRYDLCVSNLLLVVYNETVKCLTFVPRDENGMPDFEIGAPCLHATAKAVKNIPPSCEPVLNPETTEEPKE